MEDLILNGEGLVFLAIKVGLLLFLLLYLVFAAVVIKQARMMTETLQVGFEAQIKFIVILHFVLAFLVFIMSIFIL